MVIHHSTPASSQERPSDQPPRQSHSRLPKQPIACYPFQSGGPFPFFESQKDPAVVQKQDGPLDQHAILGQQIVLGLFIHFTQLVLQPHFLIELAAGVEEFFQRQTALLVPLLQLLGVGFCSLMGRDS